jgi:hypothetical protein
MTNIVHAKTLTSDKINSALAAIEYCKTALASDLEEWERKEYTSVLKTNTEMLDEAEAHMELLETM